MARPSVLVMAAWAALGAASTGPVAAAGPYLVYARLASRGTAEGAASGASAGQFVAVVVSGALAFETACAGLCLLQHPERRLRPFLPWAWLIGGAIAVGAMVAGVVAYVAIPADIAVAILGAFGIEAGGLVGWVLAVPTAGVVGAVVWFMLFESGGVSEQVWLEGGATWLYRGCLVLGAGGAAAVLARTINSGMPDVATTYLACAQLAAVAGTGVGGAAGIVVGWERQGYGRSGWAGP